MAMLSGEEVNLIRKVVDERLDVCIKSFNERIDKIVRSMEVSSGRGTGMSLEQKGGLRPGDKVRRLKTGEMYIVSMNYGERVAVFRQADILDPEDWEKVVEPDTRIYPDLELPSGRDLG